MGGGKRMNLPNKLTILRIIMIPVFILMFYLDFAGRYYVAAGIFVLAFITDILFYNFRILS